MLQVWGSPGKSTGFMALKWYVRELLEDLRSLVSANFVGQWKIWRRAPLEKDLW